MPRRSTSVVVSTPARSRATPTSITVRGPPLRPRRRRTRSIAANLSSRNNGSASFAASYARTLSDPFEYGPVPLGYDCFLPTTMATLYVRGSFFVNATDGSFSLSMTPQGGSGISSVTSPVMYNNSGASNTTTPIGVEFFNQVPVTSAILESRVVSSGIRCFALFPETAAPGVLFAGNAADQSITTLRALSVNALAALPGSELGIGTCGASVTSRPYDNGSFEFYTGNTVGNGGNAIPFHTSSYIVGQGFPTSTVIWYEAILHLEGLTRTATSAVSEPIDEIPSAARYFPTPEALWSGISSILTSPVMMDAAAGAAQIAGYGALSRGIRGASSLRRLHGSTQSMFGRGSVTPTGAILRAGRESRMMIEEMKEDANPPSTRGRFF